MPDKIKSIFAHNRYLLPAIYLAAFAVRLIYLVEIKDMPTVVYPVMDEQYHLHLVEKIKSPDGQAGEPYFRAPLYPYFLALLTRITGDSLFFARLIQLAIGSLIPLLIFKLGRMLFDRKVALTSSIIAVLFPTFLYYDASLLITFLMTLLTLLLVRQLYQTQNNPVLSNFVLCGLLLGITALARPNILLLGPALFIWVLLVLRPSYGFKKAMGGYLATGLATLVIILPVTIRNYVVSDEFVLISWQGGFNFYLGNHNEASGWSATAPGIDQTWQGGYDEAIAIANHESKQELRYTEISDYWYEKALKEIRVDLSGFVYREIKKLRLLINGYEIPNNQPIYISREFAPILRPLMFTGAVYFPFGLVAPLALIGLALSLRHWRRFLVVYLTLSAYSLSLLLFFVCARFRQPIMPFLILMAVYSVFELVGFIQRKQWIRTAFFIAAFIALLLESNHDILEMDEGYAEAEGYFALGAALMEHDKELEAEEYFLQAVTHDPSHAVSHNNLGIIRSKQGDYNSAVGHYQKALKADPNSMQYTVNLATAFIQLKQWNNAIPVLNRAVGMNPNDDYVYYNLGIAFHESGRLRQAASALSTSLRLNPNNRHARKLHRQIMIKLNR